MHAEYVVYRSATLTVEWYCGVNGRSQSLNYFKDLSGQEQDKFLCLLHIVDKVSGIVDRSIFRYEGKSIYAIKLWQHRFYCFFTCDTKIVITNAYKKKRWKGSVTEHAKAVKARENFFERRNQGTYYD